MKIADGEIGPGHPVWIVADVSCSHEGDIGKAKELIGYAKDAGADAVKFQAYTPDDMCPKSKHPAYKLTSGPWSGTLYNLYKKAQTPYKWFPELFDCATSHKLIPFASVFSCQGVNMLEELDCPVYKIASAEITDIPLLRYVAATKKPIVVSTGMADDDEIYVALRTILKDTEAWDNVALLHCVSQYPAPFESMNLRRLSSLAGACAVGLSDHSRDLIIPPMAVALRASIIEKHIMDYEPNESLDSGFALNPWEFAEFVKSVRDAEAALDRPTYDAEVDSRQFRRRLVYTQDIHAGDMITADNTRTARCSEGIYPVRLDSHMIADVDAKSGDPVT